MQDIVIVGGSLAGVRAAQELREQQFTGSITVLTDENELPYDRPPLSKQFLTGEADRAGIALVTAEELSRARINYQLDSRAQSLDLESGVVTTHTGRAHPYDALIIATGLRPRTLPGMTCGDRVHVLRTVGDALGIKAAVVRGGRIGVLGAGFLGAEIASSAVKLGAEVTVLERDPLPMSSVFGTEIATRLAGLHEHGQVRLRTGCSVTAVVDQPRSRTVVVETLGGPSEEFDHVVIALGAVPNTEWLADSGLEIADGVVCDPTLFAAPSVTVAGDVARVRSAPGVSARVEHWTHASMQAEVAARNLLVGQEAAVPFQTVSYAWSDQFGSRIETLGSPRGDQTFDAIWRAEDGSGTVWAARDGAGITALVAIDAFRPLLGVRRRLAQGAALGDAVLATETFQTGLAVEPRT